jgi:hypothetical protein
VNVRVSKKPKESEDESAADLQIFPITALREGVQEGVRVRRSETESQGIGGVQKRRGFRGA